MKPGSVLQGRASSLCLGILFCLQLALLPSALAQSKKGNSDADLEFLRWKEKQAQVAKERQAEEVGRLRPLVQQTSRTDNRQELDLLLEQIENSLSLDEAVKKELLAPLREQEAVLLCAEATAALGESQLEAARSRIIQAGNSLKVVRDPTRGLEVLTETQGAYVDTACKMAEQAASDKQMERAQTLVEHARAMRALLAIPDSPVRDVTERRIASAEQRINERSVDLTIEKASQAERDRNLRLAMFLYQDAKRQGGNTDEAMDRIDDQRRSPFLEGTASLLFPGLGQLISGRPVPALLFFAGTGSLATTAVLLNMSAEDRYDRYLMATSAESAENRYDGITLRATAAAAVFGSALLLHLWNIYDAYADAAKFNRDHFQ